MSSNEGRIAWVTGAKGFLGRHVSREFASRGWRVVGIGRGHWTDHGSWGVDEWVEADVTRTSIGSVLERLRRGLRVSYTFGISFTRCPSYPQIPNRKFVFCLLTLRP